MARGKPSKIYERWEIGEVVSAWTHGWGFWPCEVLEIRPAYRLSGKKIMVEVLFFESREHLRTRKLVPPRNIKQFKGAEEDQHANEKDIPDIVERYIRSCQVAQTAIKEHNARLVQKLQIAPIARMSPMDDFTMCYERSFRRAGPLSTL